MVRESRWHVMVSVDVVVGGLSHAYLQYCYCCAPLSRGSDKVRNPAYYDSWL
jgi:hypothetical protein